MKKIKLILYIFSFTLIFLNILKAENSEQVNKISKDLRCLICQGQSVYDSQSDFSESMKIVVRKKLESGMTENEIYLFLTEKYGDWLLYDPKLKKNTLLLWLIPLLFFILGGVLIFRKLEVLKK